MTINDCKRRQRSWNIKSLSAFIPFLFLCKTEDPNMVKRNKFLDDCSSKKTAAAKNDLQPGIGLLFFSFFRRGSPFFPLSCISRIFPFSFLWPRAASSFSFFSLFLEIAAIFLFSGAPSTFFPSSFSSSSARIHSWSIFSLCRHFEPPQREKRRRKKKGKEESCRRCSIIPPPCFFLSRKKENLFWSLVVVEFLSPLGGVGGGFFRGRKRRKKGRPKWPDGTLISGIIELEENTVTAGAAGVVAF